ncbi:MAG: fecE, partial [Devosia sp.]|nr:fecE [Devosia sp.]
MSGLVISGASVVTGSRTILDAVNLTARTGQLTGLIGPNGAGKSTLMRASLGLQPLSSGNISFDGTDLSTLSRRD